MKIIADFNNIYITSLAAQLENLGHIIIPYTNDSSPYDLVKLNNPNLSIACNYDSKFTRCLNKTQLPTILYGYGELQKSLNTIGMCVNRKQDDLIQPILLDNFGDDKIYGGYEQYSLYSDILFSTNFSNEFTPLANELILKTTLKIKIAGNKLVGLPSFVGLTTNEEFGSLARSAKIVISCNIFEYLSLIQSDVCCLLISNVNQILLNELLTNEKSRRNIIKETKSKFKDNTAKNQAVKIHNRIKEWKS